MWLTTQLASCRRYAIIRYSDVYPNESPLTQATKLAHSTNRSTTVLRPAWFNLIKELNLPARAIPRPVPTRWNSTCALLDFLVEYETAITVFTTHQSRIKDCHFTGADWTVIRQLREILSVSLHHSIPTSNFTTNASFCARYSMTRHFSFQKPTSPAYARSSESSITSKNT